MIKSYLNKSSALISLIKTGRLFKKVWGKVKDFMLDILFPVECLGCGKQNIWLCESCFKKIKLTQKDRCIVCKRESFFGKTHEWCQKETYLDGLIVCVPFDNKIIQSAIHRLKYNFIRELASPLSEILINKIKQLDAQEGEPHWLRLLFSSNLILVPVPLHRRRLNWRGFNQAELLAKEMVKVFSLIMRPYILKRVKATQAQTKLKRSKRLKNIQDAFKINKEWQDKLKSTKVLLVDDISTTGATLNECARVLKQNGAQEVWGVVLTRG